MGMADELYHYGVKGMKWGVRKERRVTKKVARRKAQLDAQLKRLDLDRKAIDQMNRDAVDKVRSTNDSAIARRNNAARRGSETPAQRSQRNAANAKDRSGIEEAVRFLNESTRANEANMQTYRDNAANHLAQYEARLRRKQPK